MSSPDFLFFASIFLLGAVCGLLGTLFWAERNLKARHKELWEWDHDHEFSVRAADVLGQPTNEPRVCGRPVLSRLRPRGRYRTR